MNDIAHNGNTRRHQRIRLVLLMFALLTSPALCCGGMQLLDALPSSRLPAAWDFALNLFEGSAHVENDTSEVFYITAITTTYGYPQVIPQNIAFRQRNIPLTAGSSITLQYDSADLPLSAIVICRSADDCRQLPVNNLGVYVLNSYESLEKLDPDMLESIQASPQYNYGSLIVIALGLVSILLFSGWIFFKQREDAVAG